ncbi:hypothetical protein [Haliscomenobacter hydrossis]|uniref:Uncharacterized protein n=1 Tax=Haliscomenobacter hydrossis (strain ATCC 27775 / DSM 1100 / LMG 10767 / O) TaxID=760192 RepID=F4L079_HALH1|nr:hypothetical protein [Haliscomenobacter hydrossis]AEE53752.1 hypothetical protein Halhy_5929 [Haliscomenobacter hydrossis DSM 1100]
MPTKKEVASELAREIKVRQKGYPAMIQAQLLHPDHARNQIDRITTAFEVIEAMTESEFAAFQKRSKESTLNTAIQATLKLI